MALYDRPYMNGGGSGNFGEGRGYAGWGGEFWRTAVGGLIAANAAIFFLTLISYAFGLLDFIPALELSPLNAKRGFLWSFFTYSFIHAHFFHLLFNMIALYFFGVPLEGRFGARRFLQFYFLGAFFAGFLWLAITLLFGEGYGLIGASGAVMCMFALYCNLMGRRPINVLIFFFIPVKISPTALFKAAFLIEAFSCLFFEILSSGYSAVAFSAHLGGLITGYVAAKIILREWPTFKFNMPSFALPKFFKRKRFAEKRGWQTPASYKIDMEDPSARRREIDRILDKINAKGFSSLSEDERQTLKGARDKPFGKNF